MEYILDLNYLLLKNSAGESQKLQFNRDRVCTLNCNYLLLKSSSGGRVKYSSTRIWNVFLDHDYLLSYQIQIHRDMEYVLDCNYLLLKKTPLGRESNTVPQGYGMYFRL